MALPSAAPREPSHRRIVDYESYRRADGLWDIEGTVRDTKAYAYYDLERGALSPGEFVHDISVRVTIDSDMTVVDIVSSMDAIPFTYCRGSGARLPVLVGANLGRGWRKRLEQSLSRALGCTHMREMLLGVATVAFQTLSAERERRVGEVDPDPRKLVERPFYIGGCHSLTERSEIVREFYPQFADDGAREE